MDYYHIDYVVTIQLYIYDIFFAVNINGEIQKY